MRRCSSKRSPARTPTIPLRPTSPFQSIRIDQPPLKGLKIGLVKEHFVAGSTKKSQPPPKPRRGLQEARATVEELSLPHSKYGIATYYIIAPSEASSNLARYDGVHYGHRCNEDAMLQELAAEAEDFARRAQRKQKSCESRFAPRSTLSKEQGRGVRPEVQRRIMLGTYTLSAGYYDAYIRRPFKCGGSFARL